MRILLLPSEACSPVHFLLVICMQFILVRFDVCYDGSVNVLKIKLIFLLFSFLLPLFPETVLLLQQCVPSISVLLRKPLMGLSDTKRIQDLHGCQQSTPSLIFRYFNATPQFTRISFCFLV